MAIKHGYVNPLNVLGFRFVNRIPDHFHKINVELGCDITTIKRWIFTNLNSRFSVTKQVIVNKNGNISESTIIGFEDPKETTMFMLTCPYLENRRFK
jgi:hypothetical protein